MQAASLTYDVTGVAREEIRRLESASGHARKATSVFTFLVRLSPRTLADLLAKIIGSFVARRVDAATMDTRTYVLAFRSIKDDMSRQIRATGIFPDAQFLANLEDLQAILLRNKAQCEKVAADLRRLNSRSRVAGAFDKLSSANSDMYEAVYQVRLVAIGAEEHANDSWEQEVARARAQFLMVSNRAADFDVSNEDPELLALADQAVAVSSSRDVKTDPAWSRRLSDTSLH